MKKKYIYLFIIFSLISNLLYSKRNYTVEEYIKKYKGIAKKQMKIYNIPASIKLGQAILESNHGNSELALKSRNHFGIKCHSSWKKRKYKHDDDEKQECFRKYPSPKKSFIDHSEFLINNKRYNFLFSINPPDYKAWAYGLKKAGYATNPKYPEILIKIIEENKLYKFDKYLLKKFKRKKN